MPELSKDVQKKKVTKLLLDALVKKQMEVFHIIANKEFITPSLYLLKFIYSVTKVHTTTTPVTLIMVHRRVTQRFNSLLLPCLEYCSSL